MMISHALLQNPPDSAQPAVAVDLEGTLTAGSAWRGMYDYLIAHGREREAKRFFYQHIPEYFLRKIAGRDMRDFKNRWIFNLLQLFRGYSVAQFRDMAYWAVENELWPSRRLSVIEEMGQHLQHERRVIVVSGLFEPYIAALLDRLPGVEAIGTPLVFEEGLLTGQLASPFNVGSRKAEALTPFAQDGKIFSAYGDTGPDRFMLEISQHPIAVHPDKTLRRLAEARGWRILEEVGPPANAQG